MLPILSTATAPFARRLAPAVLLTVLAPIVAEFLLGDFSIRNLPLLFALPLYGCGALLIREVVRRTGRGWPAIVLLGTAYSLLEEGFLTQSLFNPNYVGQRLLDYGYIPPLGTSLNWSLFVLSIHVVWSIATPILIAEGVASAGATSDRRTRPWLNTPGVAIVTVLFVLGCASTTFFTLNSSTFVATMPQFLAAGLLVLLTAVSAFTIGARAAAHDVHVRSASVDSRAPWPLWVFLVTFALAVVFMMAEPVAKEYGLAPFVSVLVRVGCEAIAAVLIVRWSRMRAWEPRHYLALAAGTTLTYALFGLAAFLEGQTHLGVPTDWIDIAGQIVLAFAVFTLIWWGSRRRVSQECA